MKTTREITGINCLECGTELWACSKCDKIIKDKIRSSLTPEQLAYDRYVTRLPTSRDDDE